MNRKEMKDILIDALLATDENHRLTREKLKDVTHLTDRENRNLIMYLRHDGWFIMSDPSCNGYYISHSYDDFEKFEARLKARHNTERLMLERIRRGLFSEGI